MEKEERISSQNRKSTYDASCGPTEIGSNSSRSFTNSLGSDYHHDINFTLTKVARSKSLSHIRPEKYTPGEVRRIKERLLRTSSHIQTSDIRGLSRNQKMTLASLALVDFMSFCSMSIMAPFFPREASEKGLSDTMSGFVFSFYALVMFVMSPIFGKILPRVGAKFLFLAGMFIAGSCNLLFGALEYIYDYTLFTTFCFLIRGFEALGASAYSTASYVFVINSFPNNIGSVLGILETFVGLGMSSGPAVGGLLYSLGGFQTPFYVLGVAMIAIIPINCILLPQVDESEFSVGDKSASVFKLIKIPAVMVTGLIVVVVSSAWAFLDPTLEPHLRQFSLSPEKVGLIFLLFSALYGISSLAWGWITDKVNNHWSMMVCGLIFATIGLLLLGPCPYIPYLNNSLWLNLVALSILGVSVALTLLPTFQSVLNSARVYGFGNSLSTYSVVAGLWSCMYSLGEVLGPSLGGFFLENYGFPYTSTIMASMTFALAVITLVYFLFRDSDESRASSDSGLSEDEDWRSESQNNSVEVSTEKTPLLMSLQDSGYRVYTEEKVLFYGKSRKNERHSGDPDNDELTDVRGTVAITSHGACEV